MVKSLGITLDDVKACTDVQQLKEWKLQIDGELLDVNTQLDNAKSTRYETGAFADHAWFRTARNFRGVLTLFLSHINQRLGSINTVDKTKRQTTWDQQFVQAAKRILSPALYADIVNQTNQEATA